MKINKTSINIVTLVVVCLFIIDTISWAIPCDSNQANLSTWTVTERPDSQRGFIASLYRQNRLIWPAIHGRYQRMLDRFNAKGMLLTTGRYLIEQDIIDDDLALIRVVTHEDYEVLMQKEEKLNPEKYNELKNRILGETRIIALYTKLSHYKDVKGQTENIIFNDLIAKAFELYFLIEKSLVYPKEDLTTTEMEFLDLLKPVIEERDALGEHKNFPSIFYNFEERLKLVYNLQKDRNERFYRVASKKSRKKKEEKKTNEGKQDQKGEPYLTRRQFVKAAAVTLLAAGGGAVLLNLFSPSARDNRRIFLLGITHASYVTFAIIKDFIGCLERTSPNPETDIILKRKLEKILNDEGFKFGAAEDKKNLLRIKEFISDSGNNISSIGVEFYDEGWRGLQESASRIGFDTWVSLFNRIGIENPRQAAEDLFLHYYGPIGFLFFRNDPILNGIEIVLLENKMLHSAIWQFKEKLKKDMDLLRRLASEGSITVEELKKVDDFYQRYTRFFVEPPEEEVFKLLKPFERDPELLQLVRSVIFHNSEEKRINDLRNQHVVNMVLSRGDNMLIVYGAAHIRPIGNMLQSAAADDLDVSFHGYCGQILKGISLKEAREVIQKRGGPIPRNMLNQDFMVLKSILGNDSVLSDNGQLQGLEERLGARPGTITDMVTQARDDLLEGKKRLKLFPAIIRGPNKYCLGLATNQYLAYSQEIFNQLSNDAYLRAEYLFHEALCYYLNRLRPRDGHQIAREIQKILFPQNYENIVPREGDTHPKLTGRLTLILRDFIASGQKDSISHLFDENIQSYALLIDKDVLTEGEPDTIRVKKGFIDLIEKGRVINVEESSASRSDRKAVILDIDIGRGRKSKVWRALLLFETDEKTREFRLNSVSLRIIQSTSGEVFAEIKNDEKNKALYDALMDKLNLYKGPRKKLSKDVHCGLTGRMKDRLKEELERNLIARHLFLSINERFNTLSLVGLHTLRESESAHAIYLDILYFQTVVYDYFERFSISTYAHEVVHHYYNELLKLERRYKDKLKDRSSQITGKERQAALDLDNIRRHLATGHEELLGWIRRQPAYAAKLEENPELLINEALSYMVQSIVSLTSGVHSEGEKSVSSYEPTFSDIDLLVNKLGLLPRFLVPDELRGLPDGFGNNMVYFYNLAEVLTAKGELSCASQIAEGLLLRSDLLLNTTVDMASLFNDKPDLLKAFETAGKNLVDEIQIGKIEVDSLDFIKGLIAAFRIFKYKANKTYIRKAVKELKRILENPSVLLRRLFTTEMEEVLLLEELLGEHEETIELRPLVTELSFIGPEEEIGGPDRDIDRLVGVELIPPRIPGLEEEARQGRIARHREAFDTGPLLSMALAEAIATSQRQPASSEFVQDISTILDNTVKRSDLNPAITRLNAAAQREIDASKLHLSLPIEVLKNSADVASLLKRIGEGRGGAIPFELIITGVKEEDFALIAGLNNKDIRARLNLPDNLNLVIITEHEIQERASLLGKDGTNPQIRTGIIKDLYMEILGSQHLAKDEYMAIATDAVTKEEAEVLKDTLAKDLQENISIRVLVRPDPETSMFSLSDIINDWRNSIRNGQKSTIEIILPRIMTSREMIQHLNELTRAFWGILRSA